MKDTLEHCGKRSWNATATVAASVTLRAGMIHRPDGPCHVRGGGTWSASPKPMGTLQGAGRSEVIGAHSLFCGVLFLRLVVEFIKQFEIMSTWNASSWRYGYARMRWGFPTSGLVLISWAFSRAPQAILQRWSRRHGLAHSLNRSSEFQAQSERGFEREAVSNERSLRPSSLAERTDREYR